MKREIFFRIITILGLIAIVIFIANAASAVQLNQIDWDAKSEWSSVGHCGIHDRCLLISNLTSAVESHRSFARPQLSSKVIRIEKKVRKPIKVISEFKSGGKKFKQKDLKNSAKFWAASLDEKKKYPLSLRRKFIHTRRGIEMRAKFNEWRKKREKTGKRPPPPIKPRPYTKEEIEILGTHSRRMTRGEIIYNTRNGKVSNQSKVGNKVINLEVK